MIQAVRSFHRDKISQRIFAPENTSKLPIYLREVALPEHIPSEMRLKDENSRK